MIHIEFQELLNEFNLTEEFTLDVVDELDEIKSKVTEKDLKGRRDLRNMNIFTIDGEDAKDLDDAVSIESLPNGNYSLGVHIADVNHYVKEGSAIDREAQHRGTSVYLVDKVIPMLPRKLSNGICSLNPDVDRLTLSVFMEINDMGNVLNYDICESVIRSKHRMTYTKVTAMLNGDKDLIEEYQSIYEDLKEMQTLARALHDKRVRRGALDFDFPEAKVITDDMGKPIDIKKYEITVSNNIIEEFMLACNETIARHMTKLEFPMVYRVHERPESSKIAKFALLLHGLGYDFKLKEKVTPNQLQNVLKAIEGTDEELIISTIMLRSLMKARYSEENLGHFGLAAIYYCHFTSPIRRYPDLAVHRIVKEWLAGKIDDRRKMQLNLYVQRIADESSQAEINATEAERVWKDMKICEYMAEHVGEEFEGIISTVTSFGLFIELPNTVDGLVRMSDLEDDYYIYDEVHFCLIGRRKGRRYDIGQKMKVRLVRVSVELGQIDFVPIENESSINREDRRKKDGYKKKDDQKDGKKGNHKGKNKAKVKVHKKGKKNKSGK